MPGKKFKNWKSNTASENNALPIEEKESPKVDQNRWLDNDDYEDYGQEDEESDEQPIRQVSPLKRRFPPTSSSLEDDVEEDGDDDNDEDEAEEVAVVTKKKVMPPKTRTTKSLSVDIATELHARMRIYCFKNNTNLVKVIEKWIVQNCPE